MSPLAQQLIALALSIAVVVLIIALTRLSAFPALIIGGLTMGIAAGMKPADAADALMIGFGNTMGKVGFVIGLGIMLGKLLEVSGGAKSLAIALIRKLGKGREPIAMAGAGYLVAIPIFSDSGFLILFEIAKALSATTKRSILLFSFALTVGLSATHSAVPPTPGPIAVAEEFGADLGQMILFGMITCLPMTFVGLCMAYWLEKRLYQIPDGKGGWTRERQPKPEFTQDAFAKLAEGAPHPLLALAPILLPLLLILSHTFTKTFLGGGAQGLLIDLINFTGKPYIAILLGLLLGLATLGRAIPRAEMSRLMAGALATAGMIVFVTCSGGAFGHIIRESGIENAIKQLAENFNLPLLLLPFAVTCLLKIAQGSGTVAMLTSAAICAPIFIDSGYNPVLPALSACCGGFFMSHLNDSFFWVFKELNHFTEAETFKYHSLPKSLETFAGLATVLLLSRFI